LPSCLKKNPKTSLATFMTTAPGPADEIRLKVRNFITTELIGESSYPLGDDEAIITGGLIDSFSLAELAVFIENEFHVTIPNPNLTVEKMDTLDRIVLRIKQSP
jgi:acyl carrier protein